METKDVSLILNDNIVYSYISDIIPNLPDLYVDFQNIIQAIPNDQIVTNLPTCISERPAFFDNYSLYKK